MLLDLGAAPQTYWVDLLDLGAAPQGGSHSNSNSNWASDLNGNQTHEEGNKPWIGYSSCPTGDRVQEELLVQHGLNDARLFLSYLRSDFLVASYLSLSDSHLDGGEPKTGKPKTKSKTKTKTNEPLALGSTVTGLSLSLGLNNLNLSLTGATQSGNVMGTI